MARNFKVTEKGDGMTEVRWSQGEKGDGNIRWAEIEKGDDNEESWLSSLWNANPNRKKVKEIEGGKGTKMYGDKKEKGDDNSRRQPLGKADLEQQEARRAEEEDRENFWKIFPPEEKERIIKEMKSEMAPMEPPAPARGPAPTKMFAPEKGDDGQLVSKQERMLQLERDNPDLDVLEKGSHALRTAPIDLDGDGKIDIQSIELGEEPEGSQERTIKTIQQKVEDEGLDSIREKIESLQKKYEEMLKEKK